MAEKTVCFTIIYETENQKPVSRMGGYVRWGCEVGVFLSGDTAWWQSSCLAPQSNVMLSAVIRTWRALSIHPLRYYMLHHVFGVPTQTQLNSNHPSCLVTHVSYLTRILCFWSSGIGVQHSPWSCLQPEEHLSSQPILAMSPTLLISFWLASLQSSPASLQSIDREAGCTMLGFLKGISPLIS